MSIEKPKSKKPGFSLDETDNFNVPEIVENKAVEEIQNPSGQPKKRGRKPGTKLAKPYKFQLVPGADETQMLITIPVGLHEKIKAKAAFLEQSVKEYVSKLLADRVGFEYKKDEDDDVYSEASAITAVVNHPWVWDSIEEQFKTPLVFQNLINLHPDWYRHLKDVSPELKSTISKEQWLKIAMCDYNSIKSVPKEHLNFVLKNIKEKLNEYGEDNSNQQS